MTLPRDWQEQDILLLIANGIKESIELDYKTCDALQKSDGKKKEVSKDISAFANSAGGTIVYGVQEDKHQPTAIDVGYDPRGDITKEWLEQVISSNIQPRLEQVYINQVELKATQPGKVLYVVEIPQATIRAPHQASDKRYYKRFNFESAPMEDYEIRDVMRRQQGPDLHLRLSVTFIQGPIGGTGGAAVALSIINTNRVEAKYVTVTCTITTAAYQLWFDHMPNSQRVHRLEDFWVIPDGSPRQCHYSVGSRRIVYPDLPLVCPHLAISSSVIPDSGPPITLEFGLYAEGMRGKCLLASFLPKQDEQIIDATEIRP